MDRKEYIRSFIFLAIAFVVLICGILVSRRNNQAELSESSNQINDSVESEDAAQPEEETVLPVAQTGEPQYIDLFSGIHLFADGIYPDISNIHMTGDADDALVQRLSYDVTNVSDFTVTGAEVTVEVDTEPIADYLHDRNYLPYSTKNVFAIEPKKCDCYLIQKDQLTDEIYNELAALAAEAVTGSADEKPICASMILPIEYCIFTPQSKSYAGLYGVYFFFQTEDAFSAAFVCPVFDGDGKLKSQEITLSESYSEYLDAYEATVKQRIRNNSELRAFLL